ncbi:unnamed protein product [Caenorhabditis nigoni]
MASDVISYKSDPKIIDMKSHVLDSSTRNSLKCVWSGFVMEKRGPISFSWTFDLQEWKNAGYSGFTGYILVKPVLNDQRAFPPIQIGCDLSKSVQMVTRTLKTDGEKRKNMGVMFEYYLLPIVNPELEIVLPKAPEFIEVGPATPEVSSSNEVSETVVSYGDLFLPSEKNDTILVVGAKLLYVNKEHLSYYSDYFEALFTSSEDNEENLNLPYSIDDVEYEDFELLIRAIYPDIKFPSDECFPKLLELAEHFKMQIVTQKVENQLLNTTKFEIHELLLMADKYRMPRLLERAILMMNSTEKAKKLKASAELAELSLETKGHLFERLIMII